MLRKIAISGMKGRKKDTFLFSFVILLSFLFIVIATILYSSSERTKIQQRTNMYGKWHGVVLDVDEYIEKDLHNTKDVDRLGKTKLVGKSHTLGNVGTFNQDFLNMSGLQLHEGKFPESDDEIALELNQLSYFSHDIKVGDTIPVEVMITLVEEDWASGHKEQMERLMPEMEENYEDYAPKPGEWQYSYIQELRRELELKEDEPIPPEYIFNLMINSITRNEPTLEIFDGTKVVIKTSYLYYSIGSADEVDDNIIEVKENGSMISQTAVITRNMVVSGIVQTYSNLWDVDEYPVANAFITEEAGAKFLEKGFYLTEEWDVSHYLSPVNYFIQSNTTSEEFFNSNKDKLKNLRRNALAYPDLVGSTEATLTYGILAFIFIATIFSVFQIYLTQMKRRTRKIALLKSIGATNKQIRKILIWEVIYLLIYCIPIGLIGGILIVKLILLIMNNMGNTQLSFYIDYNLLFLGIMAGVFSVIIGMTIPMIKAMKVPLTGNVSRPPKHKKVSTRDRLNLKFKGYDIKTQSFSRISTRHIKFNRGNILLTLSIYSITIFVLLGSIYLSFLSFKDYIDRVILTDKPSYGYELDYGMRRREIPEFTEEIKSVKGVERVELYKAGEHAFLWYEGIEDNKIYSKFKTILPEYLIDEHFGINSTDFVNLYEDNKYLIEDSLVANIYGIYSEDELYKRFEESISVGSIDREKFEKGEEVLLLLPLYYPIDGEIEDAEISDKSILENTVQKNRVKTLLKSSNIYDINYDFRYSEYYLRDRSISPGDFINLTIPTERIEGDSPTNDVAFHKLKVSGIIYYFPEKGIWPFSDTIENPVVIGSYNLIGDLYPASVMGKGNLSQVQLKYLISSLTPTKYGKTWVYIHLDKKSNDIQVQVDLQRIARERDIRIYNFKESNNIIFGKGFRIASIIVILGISIAIIALIILYNTTLSKVEQERERIGILQALGVTGPQFKKLYLITGVLYGLVSLILANILMSIVVLATSVGSSGPVNIDIVNQLYLYPWNIHFIVCFVFLVITILTYYLPLKDILNKQPVDNIRSLSR